MDFEKTQFSSIIPTLISQDFTAWKLGKQLGSSQLRDFSPLTHARRTSVQKDHECLCATNIEGGFLLISKGHTFKCQDSFN